MEIDGLPLNGTAYRLLYILPQVIQKLFHFRKALFIDDLLQVIESFVDPVYLIMGIGTEQDFGKQIVIF